MHPREEIRNTIRDLLIDAATSAEDRVIPWREVPVTENDTPCILIYDMEEDVSERTDKENNQSRTREVILSIEPWIDFAASTARPDGVLDDLCQAIETVMDANQHLTLVETERKSSHQYEGTKKGFYPANKNLYLATLTYRVGYLG